MRLLHAGHDHGGDRPRQSRGPSLDEAAIRHGLEGNICRCTGYHNIVKAVAQGAREMAAAATPKAAE